MVPSGVDESFVLPVDSVSLLPFGSRRWRASSA